MNKLALVLGVVAVSSSAFAYDNSYNCTEPEGGSDTYAKLFDSAGNTITVCAPLESGGVSDINYDLTSITFITGYSGTTPIEVEAFGNVEGISLSANPSGGLGYGWGISAATKAVHAGYACSWSVERGTYSATAVPICFDQGNHSVLSISVENVIP